MRANEAAKAPIRNTSHRNAALRAVLAVSACGFWELIGFFWMMDELTLIFAVRHILLGALSAFVLSRTGTLRFKPLALIAGSAVPCAVCYNSFSYLFSDGYLSIIRIFTGSRPGMAAFAGRIFSIAPEYIIRDAGLLLTVLSFPFMLFVCAFVIHYAMSLCGGDSLKHLIRTFRTVSLRSAAVAHLRFLAHIAVSTAAGILLLCAAYSIPTGPIDSNIARSVDVLDAEGAYPTVASWCYSPADNFTDSLILLEAGDDTDAPLLERVMLNYHGTEYEEQPPIEALVGHYRFFRPLAEKTAYPRYWHGYLIFIKPLMCFTDLNGIRLLNLAAQLLLAVLLCCLLAVKKCRGLILPFVISYLMLLPFVIGRNLQYSSCYYILVICSAAVICAAALLHNSLSRNRRMLLIFLYIGIAVAYFDYLTYPAAAFGIPAVVYIFMLGDISLSEKTLRLFKAGYSWLFGYAVMWGMKWILGSVMTDFNAIEDGFSQFLYRISDKSRGAFPEEGRFKGVLTCFKANTVRFFDSPFTVLFAAFLAVTIIMIAKRGLPSGKIYRVFAPYAFLAAIPFMWYMFALNHSIMHSAFTCKALSLTVMALMAGAADVLRYCGTRSGDTPVSGPDQK